MSLSGGHSPPPNAESEKPHSFRFPLNEII
jgi:hypothetical protein